MSTDRLMFEMKTCRGGCGAVVHGDCFCVDCDHFARDFFQREPQRVVLPEGERLSGLMKKIPRYNVGVTPMPLLARMRSAAVSLVWPSIFASFVLMFALMVRGALDVVRWLFA
ncbi:MAG: hypothetical protein ABI072_03380 [Edaphobacter sp.]